jgi:hypothetical protein
MNTLEAFRTPLLLFVFFLVISCSEKADNSFVFGAQNSPCSDTMAGALNTYYVNAECGNDNNSGTSPGEAFASLIKINSLNLEAGTHVLLKSGTTYNEQLKPKGTGAAGKPIVISKYGGEEKPIINGQGNYEAAVHIYNMPYVEIRNLEITNTGDEPESRRRGILVEAENFGEVKHTILDSLYIHDVNGSLVKSEGGGSAILWRNHGQIKTKFDHFVIQNCHLKNCARNGIVSWGYTQRANWHPSTNVIIRNNLLEGIPGDGIVPVGTDGALIERNIMHDCPDILPHDEAAAGIWPWSADNTLVQFNEVSGHKAWRDGRGFDSDWNCQNTIFQYNYSHDNYGGFLLVCNEGHSINTPKNIGTINTIVRYNISENDGIRPYATENRGWFSPCIHLTGPVDKTVIYHNLFICPKKQKENIDKTFVEMDNWGGPWPTRTLVANNSMDFTEAYSMFYGQSQQNFMVDNKYDESKLTLEQQEQIPDWASDYLDAYDETWKEKLIDAFFKDNMEMQDKIEGMK